MFHSSASENRPISPSEHGPIWDITQPLTALPTCPYTDLCVLNCEPLFWEVHDVPPMEAAAPCASTNRTSSNRSRSKEGSSAVSDSLPCPNHACSVAAPLPPGM